MEVCIAVKNGDEYGESDLLLAEVDLAALPEVGHTINLRGVINDYWKNETLLVREVNHSLIKSKTEDKYSQYITVYVNIIK